MCIRASGVPTVMVGGTCGGGFSENDQCLLTCETRGGYPADVTSYEWRLKRKFKDRFETLSSTTRSYSIVSASYRDAGDYTCHVTHVAGDVSSDATTVQVSCK